MKPIKCGILQTILCGAFFSLLSCSSAPEKQSKEKDLEKETPRETSQPEHGEIWEYVSPEKQKQTRFRSGRKVYEAYFDNNNKVSNNIFPEITDAFLHEDKYYLKIVLPFPLKGEIQFENNKGKPLYATEIDSQIIQLSLHEVLDLEGFRLKMNYFPAQNDTILAWKKEVDLKIVPGY
ncbi:hypothetical protein [Pleomorphovibrio marinus]|uniref:hypothetical protein n=1 Tax=Pleomorphovibrio marinus TaxID=2164132 RepID=UPI000E0BBF20|nr:hypothetical protein [Pleomorphovibrio marinus]